MFAAGTGSTLTRIPFGTLLIVQSSPAQVIGGWLAQDTRIVPLLGLLFTTVSVEVPAGIDAFLKTAMTERILVTATSQLPVPEQSPAHPSKTKPDAGVAISVTWPPPEN